MSPRKKQFKLFITVSPEFDQTMSYWSKKFRITKSQLGNICMQAGLGSVTRAISQEKEFEAKVIGKLIDHDDGVQVGINSSEDGLVLEVGTV